MVLRAIAEASTVWTMTGPPEDAFRELSELLFGAKERYRSARATIELTVDAAVAEEANRRFVDWRFEQTGGSDMGVIGKEGLQAREDFYHEYEDAEEVIGLWHERPDRWREEVRDAATGELLDAVAAAGRGASLWFYQPPKLAIHVPSVPEERDPDPTLAFMLDPSERLFCHSINDGTVISLTGRTTTVAGREAVEVQARTISWGYPPIVFRGRGYHRNPEGTTDHLFLVDAEVGTILRAAARLEGREFYVAAVTEIAYDEPLPEGIFRLGLPGVEFRRIER